MSGKYKRKFGKKFVMIDGYVMKSAAWAALTANDKAVYLALKWKYDGTNNGRLGMGCREAADAIGSASKDTGKRSLDCLQEKGFISKRKNSGFNVKNRVAAEWRLTEYSCDVTGELPSKEFARWAPEEKNTVRPQGQTVRPQGQWTPKIRVSNG